MSGSAPKPKPRAGLKGHEEDDTLGANLGSPPPFKPPPPRPKTKPVSAISSNEEAPPSSKDEVVNPSQVELDLDPPKDKAPTKNIAARVAPPVPKSEQTQQKSITDSPKRPAPGPPRHASSMDTVTDTKGPSSTTSPSPSIPSGPKHSRSVSTGHKLPHNTPADTEHKVSHSRQMSEHLVADDISPKITPKRAAPPPPTSAGKGDKKPPRYDEHPKGTVRSESCQQFTSIPPLAPGKQKELRPKEKKAPAIPVPKQFPQSAKSPLKQSSFEGTATKGTSSPPQRSSPKAARKASNPDTRIPSNDDKDGEPATSAKDRIKKSGIALPIALIKEQAELKKKELQKESPALSRSRPDEPTISYMESPMLASDDASRKVKFSRQLKTWLTYAREEYDRANDVNVVQAAVLYELEKLIEKMHIYSVELSKCDNVLGMHIRSQNLNSTPEVGGQILGIFVSNVSTNGPADLSGSIQVGDLLLEVDGKPMIGSSRNEAMCILNATGESVQLTLGRPSSPILIDKTVSPVVKDAPVDISQLPPSPRPLRSPTSPNATDSALEKVRPHSRSMTPDKPRPPPVAQSKPKVAPPPKPPRVKPRTHVGGAHLSGDQREGQTPTPPTSRDDTPSNDQQTPKKVEKPADSQEEASKGSQPVVEAEKTTSASNDQHHQQQPAPVVEAKVPPELLAELDKLKEENAALLKSKEDVQIEMKAFQLKVSQEHSQKEAEWKNTVLQLQNELQEKSDLLLTAEQVKKKEIEQLEHRMEESEIAAAENMEHLNSKVKETRAKYMELLGDYKEMETKNKDMSVELETTQKNLQLSGEELKNKETKYEAKIAAMEEEKAAREEKDSEGPVKVMDDKEIEKMKEELSTVREEKDKEVNELRTQLEEIKEKQSDKDKQLEELNDELATTRKTLKDNKTLLVALKEDLKSAQSCMDQMQGRNRGLTDQLKEEKDERKKKEERLIELTVEAKKYQDEAASLKMEMEEIKKKLEKTKEELKKRDELLSKYQTQVQEVSADKEKTAEQQSNVEDESKDDDQQYVNIDPSSEVAEKKKEDTKESENTNEYINVPMDDEGEQKGVKNEEQSEEADKEPDFDQVVKTEKLTSSSQLARAKVGTTLKRKPPSRGLIRRTAEESGSQENLFEIDDSAEKDYVNLPVNKAVIQQPEHKTEDGDKLNEEGNKPADSDTTTNDEKEVKHELDDKPPVVSNEDKPPLENKPAPPVAERPHPKSSPVPQVRRHKMGGVPLIPVTQQMEEVLNRQRLATESALNKNVSDGVQRKSVTATKSAKFPPPAVKKKPVRTPVKSFDALDDDKKSHEVSGGISRSLENLVAANDDEGAFVEQNNGNGKLNKRISMSMSVEDIKELKDPVKDIKELKEPVKPPAVKARKMFPGAVKLIAPKTKEGQVELTKSPDDEHDSSNPTPSEDKEDTSPDQSHPQTPEATPNSLDNKNDTSVTDTPAAAEKPSEDTGSLGNADALLLPDWTTEEVCIWLQRSGLNELVTNIKLGNVTGKVLMDLDNNKMKALGMFNNNDRKALQKEIKSVKTEHDRLKKAEKKKADAEKKLAKKDEKKKKK